MWFCIRGVLDLFGGNGGKTQKFLCPCATKGGRTGRTSQASRSEMIRRQASFAVQSLKRVEDVKYAGMFDEKAKANR